MKKKICVLLALLMLFCAALTGCGEKQEQTTIYVYNWQEYISTGEDDTLDVIAEFEKRNPDIRVEYSTYPDNETMYTKLATGGITVDVIIPSDYMVVRMADEGMLQKLNFDNIPNYKYIDDSFKGLAYDPDDLYSVPYTWGTVGIIYNKNHVAEEDLTGWEILWNEKYAGKILMFGNSRDAFGIAEYLLGYDVNTTDEAELRACTDKLKEQKPLVQQYVMDEVFSAMENEEAWLAPYYAGDFLTMQAENPDLGFYRPEDQGFNVFTDAMCIPTCAEHKEAAERFIDFLCDPEISGKNMEVLGYGSPISAAKEYMSEETANNPVVYPEAEALKNGTSFGKIPDDTMTLLENLFLEVRS